ncbi:MAG: PilW family protein [Marinobacter sp.]|nr:PilW family protein [Marinobacter sp.]
MKAMFVFHRSQQGLSLVELMIALVLGTLLTLGVIQVYIASSGTYQLTDSISRLQENARFGASVLKREIAEAGGTGCRLPGAQLDDLRRPAQVTEPLVESVVGWDFANTAIGDTVTLTGAVGNNWLGNGAPGLDLNVAAPLVDNQVKVAQSDILIAQGSFALDLGGNAVAGGPGNVVVVAPGPSTVPAGTVLEMVSGDCDQGLRFITAAAANAAAIAVAGAALNTPPANIDVPYNNADAQLYEFRSTAFYVGPDAANNFEPTLFRLPLAAGRIPEALIPGVESMQVLYGEGPDRNGAIAYVPATLVNDWDQVRSVRIALLLRSEDGVTDTPAARTFNMLGTAVTTPVDRRARLLTTTTITLRNRLE